MQNNLGQYVKFILVTIGYIVVTATVSEFIVIDQKWVHVIVTFMLTFIGYIILLLLIKFSEFDDLIRKVKKKLVK